ncbi:aminotransferase class V-fold PLP-dependent enzyme [Acuticoccus sp. MNP-M23]|uniref:aminotransferase class V-fold PLP-dependent enzyme n=1 Tax=Acuticoccus sp. MNP-M23 TaxID=3072793 RepID=UPI0028166A60|nr:aminotransferase class V-fold PLP-dependent enzyme [Acuticoccus sp. MNP-M23]WMS42379.1 aminotransferase class V-fold PLP-dependent enzyme [Acuticoccus sp. MNP-M23]
MTAQDPAYFLYHSIGQYPGKAAETGEALAAFAQSWAALDDGQWGRALTERETFLALWRRLIGAPEGSLTSAENVTTALYSVLGGLPRERLSGKRVLVAQDCFPSLHFLLAGLAPRFGFTLDTVPMRPGESFVREDDMIAAWGPDVGLALLTFVTSTASFCADHARLTAHGHAMGSLVALDLTQGIGIVPFTLAKDGPDIVLSTSLKWLCGTPGAGILYVRPELAAACAPELRGWFSQPNPFSWDLDAFDYAPDARRFDHGTPAAIACIGSVPALKWHAAADKPALLAHTRTLQATIAAEAAALGLPLASPADPEQRGGSIMVRLPESADPPALVSRLRDKAIHLDCRGSVMRISPGIVTREAHVERLFEALRAEGLGA